MATARGPWLLLTKSYTGVDYRVLPAGGYTGRRCGTIGGGPHASISAVILVCWPSRGWHHGNQPQAVVFIEWVGINNSGYLG